MKKVIILGSTGSIGKNTLDIIKNYSDFFTVDGLSCYSRIHDLTTQIEEFKPKAVAVANPQSPDIDCPGFSGKIYKGPRGILDMIEESDADIVVNGISGSRGLLPSFKALESGKDCALANKETIVMAGPLILEKAGELNKRIIPVDSEHSALFQLLHQIDPKRISEIIITASGGAFRTMSAKNLETVKLEDALKHPTWNMGTKITIDSATLGNKGLEVIEAHYLFAMPLSKIKVVIHPQSFVHSLVQTIDGCLFAQISEPDMRMPIHYALFYPGVSPSMFGTLDLAGKEFTFLPVDHEKYPMLSLAFKAAESGTTYPIVYNAANEIAVHEFITNRIPFTGIPKIVEKTLDRVWEKSVNSIDTILAVDERARIIAREIALNILNC